MLGLGLESDSLELMLELRYEQTQESFDSINTNSGRDIK
jgi:hypothetical protein